MDPIYDGPKKIKKISLRYSKSTILNLLEILDSSFKINQVWRSTHAHTRTHTPHTHTPHTHTHTQIHTRAREWIFLGGLIFGILDLREPNFERV